MLVTQATVNAQGEEIATHVEVKTQSAWTSKINWLQVVSAAVVCITAFVSALNLPAEQAAGITAGVAAMGQLLTVILRTFYTTSIIQDSVPTQKGN